MMNLLQHAAFRFLTALIAAAFCALPHSALAKVTRFEILRRTPYADGREFPGVGAYERLQGKIHFELDPARASNRPIVDLGLAPRNERGMVEFSTDFELIAPLDPAKSNGSLFYDVNNRGRRMCLRMFNEGADDFLMRQGYVVFWCGWIAEVLPIPEEADPDEQLLRMDAPIASQDGRPITGICRAEIMINEAAPRHSISNRPHIGAYRPTTTGLKNATLTWRLREKDKRVPIPRDQWRLEVHEVTATRQERCLPKVELVVAGGLQPGYIYELLYEARGPVVQGVGFAAIRDSISFLKHDTSERNPLRARAGETTISRAIGFGISQSGRCLRTLVHQGFNADEQGKQVFDGIIPHVSGGGLGYFNHRFAAPTRYSTQHVNHLYPCDMFPFSYETQRDEISGREDGILSAARKAGVVPKVMHIQNSAEYWHRAGSLVHTNTLGTQDAAIPNEVRIYAVGGAQHGWGNDVPASEPDIGQLVDNPTDYRPHLRAMLTALNEWIRDGKEPPPSVYPKIEDKALGGWQAHESGWRHLPGVRYPELINQAELLDYGPNFLDQGRIAVDPPRRLKTYPALVAQHDESNNELGMLRLPTLAVPVATYTGWNLRRRGRGAENEMVRLKGAFIPFARTRDERLASGDPRPALLERYGGFDDYLTRFHTAVDELVKQRYLLPEDAPRLLQRAKKMQPRFAPR